MTVITLPSFDTGRVRMRIVGPGERLRFIGGATASVEPPGAWWEVEIPPNLQELADARDWRAAFAQLRKASNTFLLMPPGYAGPGTGYTDTVPQVDGAGQLGTSLDIKNLTPSAAIALTGDFFEVNGEFKILTADLTADGAGLATASFETALHAAPSDSANIDIQTPQLTLGLKDRTVEWEYVEKHFHHFVLVAEEVW